MNAPPAEKIYSPRIAWLHSAGWAVYEVMFALLPGLVWWIVLVVLERPEDEIYHLPAWSFISVSVYAAMLRDSVRVFSRDNTVSTRHDREVSVIFGLVGVVLSSVLLAIGVCHAQRANGELPSIYYEIVGMMLGVGVASYLVVKTAAIRYAEFKTKP